MDVGDYMLIVNENYEIINEQDADLSAGKLIPATILREDAEPIDNLKKWAWYDDDYEKVLMYVLNPVEHESENSTTMQEDVDAMLVDHEYRLTLLELGVL